MNDNCLEGIRCPHCGWEGPFRINVMTTVLMHDDGCDGIDDSTEWDDKSWIECVNCNGEGKVSEFRKRTYLVPAFVKVEASSRTEADHKAAMAQIAANAARTHIDDPLFYLEEVLPTIEVPFNEEGYEFHSITDFINLVEASDAEAV
jgi:hypothetical protein